MPGTILLVVSSKYIYIQFVNHCKRQPIYYVRLILQLMALTNCGVLLNCSFEIILKVYRIFRSKAIVFKTYHIKNIP